MDEGIDCILSRFTVDSKLEGVADTPKVCAAVQQVLVSLESWTERNLMRFGKSKCGGLYLRRNNCMHQYNLENDLLDL